MNKGRLEAFSDGVLAIIITVMLLEMHPPTGTDLSALRPVLPSLLSYVLSYVYIGIYWNNHHHMLHATGSINGAIMWANLYLLFWLSLFPFATAWVGSNHGSPWPAAMYGFVALMAALAYTVLQAAIVRHEGKGSKLAKAVGSDVKGKLSLLGYLLAIGLSFESVWISYALYVAMAIMWIVPDRRIERHLAD